MTFSDISGKFLDMSMAFLEMCRNFTQAEMFALHVFDDVDSADRDGKAFGGGDGSGPFRQDRPPNGGGDYTTARCLYAQKLML